MISPTMVESCSFFPRCFVCVGFVYWSDWSIGRIGVLVGRVPSEVEGLVGSPHKGAGGVSQPESLPKRSGGGMWHMGATTIDN